MTAGPVDVDPVDLVAVLKQQMGELAPYSDALPQRVGVAVSGGGDSMALLLGLYQAGYAVEVATVNHHLRPEAQDEADAVAAFCAARTIPHVTLHWDGAEADGNFLDAARRARLALIGAWARGRGFAYVVIGHTADDQAETFLMRIGRDAGLEGLSGIRPRFDAEGVTWLRPMLPVSRAGLRDWLRAQGQHWFDDPSNENDHYTRSRMRKALGALHPAGVTVGHICTVVDHLASANAALDRMVSAWARNHVREQLGTLHCSVAAFQVLDPELQRRFLRAALIWVAGTDYGPREKTLRSFLDQPRDCTLHGCRLAIRGEDLAICRESRAVSGLRVPFGQDWDGWRITGPAPEGAEIAALGGDGLRFYPDWRDTGLTYAAAVVTPALWLRDQVLFSALNGRKTAFCATNLRGTFTEVGFSR